MRYYIDGKEVTKEIAEKTKQMNDLYFHLAEQGDFAALEKIQFITEALPC